MSESKPEGKKTVSRVRDVVAETKNIVSRVRDTLPEGKNMTSRGCDTSAETKNIVSRSCDTFSDLTPDPSPIEDKSPKDTQKGTRRGVPAAPVSNKGKNPRNPTKRAKPPPSPAERGWG